MTLRAFPGFLWPFGPIALLFFHFLLTFWVYDYRVPYGEHPPLYTSLLPKDCDPGVGCGPLETRGVPCFMTFLWRVMALVPYGSVVSLGPGPR